MTRGARKKKHRRLKVHKLRCNKCGTVNTSYERDVRCTKCGNRLGGQQKDE